MKPNITAHNAKERGRTIKTQPTLGKGTTNNPTGVREILKNMVIRILSPVFNQFCL